MRAPRPYHPSGHHTIRKALPELLERVADPHLPPAELSPLELAAREWRQEVLADLGGPEQVAATRMALLNAAVGTWIVLASLDRYLFELAAKDGLVNRRSRHAFAIVQDRMRVADSLTKQLQTVGLERVPAKVPTLGAYVQEKYGTPPKTGAPE
jgi:hypothetical protein